LNSDLKCTSVNANRLHKWPQVLLGLVYNVAARKMIQGYVNSEPAQEMCSRRE